MAVLMPTHQCFTDALDFIELRVRAAGPDLDLDALMLVHGIVLFPDDAYRAIDGHAPGAPFAHAWVEEGACIWEAGLLDGRRTWITRDRSTFYEMLRVQRTTRYTLGAAYNENRRSGHYGPWEPAYLALTRQPKGSV